MEEGGESVGKKRAEQGLRASGERYQEEKIPKVEEAKEFHKGCQSLGSILRRSVSL